MWMMISAMLAAHGPRINHLAINGQVMRPFARVVRLVMEATGRKLEVIENPRTDPGVSRQCRPARCAKINYQPLFRRMDWHDPGTDSVETGDRAAVF
jgi:hypothetical protein